jgi:hypothetical protein
MNETRAEWLTLAQAAAEHGLSEKTLRKRIVAGQVEGEKISLEGGGTAWRVQPMGALESGVPEVVPEPSEPRAGSETERTGSTLEAKSTVPVAERNIAPEAAATIERLAELRDEVKFLRGLVEQRDRDAAELRATLREALKMGSRALPAPGADVSPEAPEMPQSAPAGNQAQAAQSGSHRPAERDARPLWKVLLGIR